MSDDWQITGANDFFKLSKALKAAGEFEIRKELNAGLKQGVKPLIPKIREAALNELPKAGGLNERIAKQTLTPQVRTGDRTAGVRITRPGRYVAGGTINQSGTFRHPVFARKGTTRKEQKWVTEQTSAKGWFDRVMTANAPSVRPELEAAMQRIIDKIVKEAG